MSDLESMSTPPVEKRRSVRYACVLEATLAGGETTRFWPGWPARVLDISQHGVGMHVGEECAEGTILSVKLYYGDGQSCEPLPVEIVRSSRQPNGTWIVGAAFLQPISEEQLKLLLA
jgi:hypothetical protein